MNKARSMRFFEATIIFSLMLLALSCGGNGGGGGGSPGTPATMNQTTARQAMGTVMFGTTVGGLYADTLSRISPGPSATRSIFTQSMINKVLQVIEQRILNQRERAGSISGQVDCDYNGTISLSAQWDGPDQPQNCSQINNLNATVSMHDCAVDSGSSMNGSATISISGSSCNPSAVTIHFQNISFNDTDDNVSVAINDLSISLSQVTWDATQSYVTHGRVVIDGDASGTAEGVEYQAQYDHLTQIMDTSDNINFTMAFSGSVSGGCLDGWVTIETLTPIAFSVNDDCPSAGQIRLSGDIDLLVTINGDGSITAGDTEYANCNEFEMACTP